MIRFTVVNATEVQAQISETPVGIRERMVAAINTVNTQLQRHIVSDKLSGQVLKSHTGNLKRSIVQIPAVIEGDTLRGGVGLGSEAPYGLIHEFGGTIHVPEITPVNARALHWIGKDGASVFAMRVKAHDVVMPERSFMRVAFAEFTERIEAAIRRAATE